MRLIGNKTHGDLAEIAVAEFVNQYMYDFRAAHVGKESFRAKRQEEDIMVTNEMSGDQFPVSLKAYGDGPLQLSTDKNYKMYPLLLGYGECITSRAYIARIFQDDAFAGFGRSMCFR